MAEAASDEEQWDRAVRIRRVKAGIRVGLGGVLLGLGLALAQVGDAGTYLTQDRACFAAAACVYEVPSFPILEAVLVVAGAILVVAGLPIVAMKPRMPDRVFEPPLGVSLDVWSRLPPGHRLHSHLRSLSRNVRTLRLAILSLVAGVLFAGMVLAFARHGGLTGVRQDLECTGPACPTLLESPPIQDAFWAAAVGVALLVLLVKCMKRAVLPVKEEWSQK